MTSKLQGVISLVLALPLLFLALGAATPAPRARASWLDGWAKRVEITVDHAKIESTLKDFPVLIHLGSSSGITAYDVSEIFTDLACEGNRLKIAFTSGDGKTQLYAEIEKWDHSQEEAWIWVKVPEISSANDTRLFLYYDPAQADNIEMVGDTGSPAAAKVWDQAFVAVHHLYSAATGEYADSTTHRNNGLGGNGNDGKAPDSGQALAGDGPLFDGSTYITVPDSDDFSLSTTGELTFSLWISPSVIDFSTADQGYIHIMGKGDVGKYEWSFIFYNKNGTERPQRISFYLDNARGGLGTGSYTQTPFSPDDWVYLTARVDESQIYMFRNAVLSERDFYIGPDAFVEIEPHNGDEPVRLGTRNFTSYYEGRMDELRISNVARSDSWIEASYLSEIDGLLFFGAPVSGKPVLRPIGARSLTAGKTQSFTISAVDVHDREITYSSSNLPPGSSFNPATGTFTWKPDISQVGVYPGVQFSASAGGLTDSENVTLTVYAPAEAPAERDWIPFIVGAAIAVLIIVAALFIMRVVRSRRE